MSSYETFAVFYDSLTENVDYKVRNNYISNFFSRYGNGGTRVLDLACGTGTAAELLAEQGYSVTGIDLSADMLTVAKNKCPDIEFIRADMRNFSLPEKVDYCICTLDSINHLLNPDALSDCIECVYNTLNNDGLFVFDVNTSYKHKHVLANRTFVFDEEDYFISWDNEYVGYNVIKIFLDFFVFNGENYDRYSEHFMERAYTIKELKKVLSKNNFEIIQIYDDLTENPPREESERLYFICKKVNEWERLLDI